MWPLSARPGEAQPAPRRCEPRHNPDHALRDPDGTVVVRRTPEAVRRLAVRPRRGFLTVQGGVKRREGKPAVPPVRRVEQRVGAFHISARLAPANVGLDELFLEPGERTSPPPLTPRSRLPRDVAIGRAFHSGLPNPRPDAGGAPSRPARPHSPAGPALAAGRGATSRHPHSTQHTCATYETCAYCRTRHCGHCTVGMRRFCTVGSSLSSAAGRLGAYSRRSSATQRTPTPPRIVSRRRTHRDEGRRGRRIAKIVMSRPCLLRLARRRDPLPSAPQPRERDRKLAEAACTRRALTAVSLAPTTTTRCASSGELNVCHGPRRGAARRQNTPPLLDTPGPSWLTHVTLHQ